MKDYAKTGKWSPDEDKLLTQIFADKSNKEIGAQMGRPAKSVSKAGRRLKLKKSPEYISQMSRKRAIAGYKAMAEARESAKAANDDVPDFGKGVFVLPSPGPGWGPITVHRISAA